MEHSEILVLIRHYAETMHLSEHRIPSCRADSIGAGAPGTIPSSSLPLAERVAFARLGRAEALRRILEELRDWDPRCDRAETIASLILTGLEEG